MIRLHHCPQTRSMRTLWLLHELDIQFEVRTHAFDKSLRDPEYLKLSPAGRIPALDINGARMFETGAITQYLCELFPDAGLGRPPEHPERMEWLIWIHFAETISQHLAALTQQHVVLREDHMRSPAVMKLEAARLGKCYDAIEAQLAAHPGPGAMLLPSGFSAADVSVGQAVYLGTLFHTLEDHPKLSAWYDSLSARPAFQKSLPQSSSERLYRRAFYPPWEMAP